MNFLSYQHISKKVEVYERSLTIIVLRSKADTSYILILASDVFFLNN
ncbi:hypothetical protein C900_05919 [Fulvivirga imtechensis AK7]|uniref:Uncharacterized protein n=1 Tax=Fulvivirga imtechensis AK7 TaxID=1237149 RepID=L8JIP4_9BACT|nr:hypothetical protein C900_05919 [Fulvivirga imtechensis AK7]